MLQSINRESYFYKKNSVSFVMWTTEFVYTKVKLYGSVGTVG